MKLTRQLQASSTSQHQCGRHLERTGSPLRPSPRRSASRRARRATGQTRRSPLSCVPNAAAVSCILRRAIYFCDAIYVVLVGPCCTSSSVQLMVQPRGFTVCFPGNMFRSTERLATRAARAVGDERRLRAARVAPGASPEALRGQLDEHARGSERRREAESAPLAAEIQQQRRGRAVTSDNNKHEQHTNNI